MADVTVKLRLKGVNKIMTSSGATSEVVRHARRMQQAAGDGFEIAVRPHKWTARAYVQAADDEGRRREAADKVLTRAIDAGRG